MEFQNYMQRFKRYIFCAVTILLINEASFATSDIEYTIESFIASFSLFCNSSNVELVDKSEIELLTAIFNEPDIIVEYDLFDDKFLHSDVTANDYLTELRQICVSGKVKIEFSNVRYETCEESIAGTNYKVVTAEKVISYNNESKKVNLALLVDYSKKPNTIEAIYSLERFTVIAKKCSFKTESVQDTVSKILKQADLSMNTFKYTEAKALYIKSLSLSGYNSDVDAKLKKLDTLLTSEIIVQEIDRLITNKEYVTAEREIKSGLLRFPNNQKILERANNLNKILDDIKYNQYKVVADNHFKNENYTEALSYYYLAKSIKHNTVIEESIRSCQYKNSPAYIQDQILKAKKLIKKKKFGEGYLLLNKYYSPRNAQYFDGEAYYFLALIGSGNYDQIRSKLKVSINELCHMNHFYCVKSIERGYYYASELYADIFNKRTQYCD